MNKSCLSCISNSIIVTNDHNKSVDFSCGLKADNLLLASCDSAIEKDMGEIREEDCLDGVEDQVFCQTQSPCASDDNKGPSDDDENRNDLEENSIVNDKSSLITYQEYDFISSTERKLKSSKTKSLHKNVRVRKQAVTFSRIPNISCQNDIDNVESTGPIPIPLCQAVKASRKYSHNPKMVSTGIYDESGGLRKAKDVKIERKTRSSQNNNGTMNSNGTLMDSVSRRFTVASDKDTVNRWPKSQEDDDFPDATEFQSLSKVEREYWFQLNAYRHNTGILHSIYDNEEPLFLQRLREKAADARQRRLQGLPPQLDDNVVEVDLVEKKLFSVEHLLPQSQNLAANSDLESAYSSTHELFIRSLEI